MKLLKLLFLFIISFSITACYDSFVKDFEYSTIYFASQKPLRTVIADTDMKIKVGVAIGGKRTVDKDAWATFAIDSTLLVDTTFTLMPKNYYNLSNADKMTVRNTNLAIADVDITFTDAFYNDLNAYKSFYALPFKITGHNQDSIGRDDANIKKDYSIVVVKAVSKYQGTYYVRGNMVKLNPDGTTSTIKADSTVYNILDLSKNITRTVTSINRYTIQRPGFSNSAPVVSEAINLTVSPDGTNVIITSGGTSIISGATATLDNTQSQPEFSLVYKITRAGINYSVTEKLTRRQDPLNDLRFEEW